MMSCLPLVNNTWSESGDHPIEYTGDPTQRDQPKIKVSLVHNRFRQSIMWITSEGLYEGLQLRILTHCMLVLVAEV